MPRLLPQSFSFFSVLKKQAAKVNRMKKHLGFSKQKTQAAVASVPIVYQDEQHILLLLDI